MEILKSKYSLGLGAFRLILAWFVIASHCTGFYDLFTIDYGTVAVSSFFFISGFLMPLTYEKNYSSFGIKTAVYKFYLNRFTRIYPIYWASLLIFVVILPVLRSIYKGNLTLDILNKFEYSFLIWLQNILLVGLNQSIFWGSYLRLNNPAWTLDVELQYYLILPFILFFYKSKNSFVSLILITFSMVSLFIYFHFFGLVDIDRSLIAWAFFFFLGFFFYKIGIFKVNNKNLIIIAIFVILLFVSPVFIENILTRNFLISLSFILISAPLLLMQMNYQFKKSDKILGDLSYPTYILHFYFLYYGNKVVSFMNLDNGQVGTFILLLSLNIFFSTIGGYLALRFIGDPIDLIRNKIRGKSV